MIYQCIDESLFLLVNSKILLTEVFLFFLNREQEMRNSILAQVLDQSARARCKCLFTVYLKYQ